MTRLWLATGVTKAGGGARYSQIRASAAVGTHAQSLSSLRVLMPPEPGRSLSPRPLAGALFGVDEPRVVGLEELQVSGPRRGLSGGRNTTHEERGTHGTSTTEQDAGTWREPGGEAERNSRATAAAISAHATSSLPRSLRRSLLYLYPFPPHIFPSGRGSQFFRLPNARNPHIPAGVPTAATTATTTATALHARFIHPNRHHPLLDRTRRRGHRRRHEAAATKARSRPKADFGAKAVGTTSWVVAVRAGPGPGGQVHGGRDHIPPASAVVEVLVLPTSDGCSHEGKQQRPVCVGHRASWRSMAQRSCSSPCAHCGLSRSGLQLMVNFKKD